MKEENGSEVNTGGGKLAGNVMRSTLQAHIFEKLLKIWAELISVVSTQLRRNTAWVLREQWHVLEENKSETQVVGVRKITKIQSES